MSRFICRTLLWFVCLLPGPAGATDNLLVDIIKLLNPPPQVMLTAPTEDASFSAPASFTVSAPPPPNNPLTLSITSPADGGIIADDRVTVSGNFQAPPHSGITVNGVIAVISGGDFHAFNVPIRTGPQTLTATLTTLDGPKANQLIAVTGGPAPGVQVRAEPRSGPAPLGVSFTITNTTPSPVRKVEVDADGDGTFDFTTSGSFNLTYPAPGTSRTVVVVTLADGSVYSQSFPIVVQDSAEIDQMFKSLWNGMNNALIAGDKATALNYLSPRRRRSMGRYSTS